MPDESLLRTLAENARNKIRIGEAPVSDVAERLSDVVGHLGVDIPTSLATCRVLIEQFISEHGKEVSEPGLEWLRRTAHPIWRPMVESSANYQCDVASQTSSTNASSTNDWAEIEELLWNELNGNRGTHGVYYTPIEVVDFLIEESLREFARSGAGWESLRVMDPAAGGGRFITQMVRQLLNGDAPTTAALDVIGRTSAMDIRPSALCATHLSVALALAREQVDFGDCPAIELCLGDSLFSRHEAEIVVADQCVADFTPRPIDHPG